MSAESKNLPKHIVIIPDGNRRWAKKHNLPVIVGHRKGLNAAFEVSKEARRLGVKILTIWGFSGENWRRPDMEVKYLMRIYAQFFRNHLRDFADDGVRFKWLGRRDRVPKALREVLVNLEKQTSRNKNYILNVCIDYAGHDEIISAIKKIVSKRVKPSQVTEELVSQNLETKGLPDPDLLIRTSGEMRTSGIMPWQTTYTELFFSRLLFPDFSLSELRRAIADYSTRQRRYGA